MNTPDERVSRQALGDIMTGVPSDPIDPFSDYHRARARTAFGRVLLAVTVIGGLSAGLTAIAGAAPAPVEPVVAEASVETPAPVSAEQPATLPTPDPEPPAEVSAPVPVPVPVPETLPDAGGPQSWSISIDTTGYQTEIDQCLWVRMDLGLDAPIVGAHNYCGGSIVLDMHLGDVVTLAGTGLDGSYVVSEERLAMAGDAAAPATAGLWATVILQTCTWEDDGSVRLLALLPAT